jgi:prefoldin subunit 5
MQTNINAEINQSFTDMIEYLDRKIADMEADIITLRAVQETLDSARATQAVRKGPTLPLSVEDDISAIALKFAAQGSRS